MKNVAIGSCEKSRAVAEKLAVGGGDTEKCDFQALVLDEGVNKNQCGIEHDGQEPKPMVKDAQHNQQQVANHESGGQEVDKLESFWIFVFQYHSCFSRMLHLAEKRTEPDTSFVIDKGIWEETAAVTAFEDPRAQIDVFAITHGSETS